MSRILKVVSFVFFLFIFNSNIYAEIIKCEYPDSDSNIIMTMTWDTDEEFNPSSNPFVEIPGLVNSDDEYHRFLFWRFGKKISLTDAAYIDQKLYKEVLDNYSCNSGMKVCVYSEFVLDNVASLSNDLLNALFSWDIDKIDLGGKKQELKIMTKEEYDKSGLDFYIGGRRGIFAFDKVQQRWDDGYNHFDFLGTIKDIASGMTANEEGYNTYYFKEAICEDVTYNGSYISTNMNCSLLMNSIVKYKSIIADYKNCDSNNDLCKSKSITDINKIEENIKSQCTSILKNHDYEGAQKECIENCLNIKDILNSYRKGTDLYDDGTFNSGQCGFSTRLLLWVVNIMKWIKYIVPALVILLGILDFIKAIVSDKDDEMKKVQGRFVKRLIAAALIFIVPFIIEFILDKMGFVANGCGVISL